jgi:hypothetical protein
MPILGNPEAMNASPLRSERIPASLPNTKEKRSEKHEQWECIVHAHCSGIRVPKFLPPIMHFRHLLKPNHLTTAASFVIRNRQSSSPILASCCSCLHFCCCVDVFDFASAWVDHNSVTSFVLRYTISSCSKVQHLQPVSFCYNMSYHFARTSM